MRVAYYVALQLKNPMLKNPMMRSLTSRLARYPKRDHTPAGAVLSTGVELGEENSPRIHQRRDQPTIFKVETRRARSKYS